MSAVVPLVRYRFGRFELQPDERRLLEGGTLVHLRPHALDLLLTFVERAGQLVTKDELLKRVWRTVVVEENTLQAHISALRKVLGSEAIATVAGHGYRFTQNVIQIGSADSSASTPKHNLPHALTSFIGREKEIAELEQLLASARLLTLTGSGGCGKTRLAIELAKQRAHAYPDGAWLVELAALTDAALLPQTVASVLSIKEKVGASLIDTIAEHLASRAVLLVLDNAEHLIDASAQLAESLLQRCARLVILVTSRERLGITGELIYRVPSLAVPDEKTDTTPESVAAYESARLFIERARLQRPDFAVTPQNSAAIASMCRRLDGIAFALELAAPRVRNLSVEELSRRLDRRFELLTEGSRMALPRHRTLRALIDWSYDLLTDGEKAMLRGVSVFAGGWTLEAAEQAFGADEPDRSSVLRLLTSLADKNLIVEGTHDGATRYGMLETVRDYARDRLRETSEHADVQDRHVAYFVALAEEANREKSDATAVRWLDTLEIEQDNFRSALSWSIQAHTDDAGVRLAGVLSWFWLIRGYITEGRRWLSAALAADGAKSNPGALGRALRAASLLAQRQDDHVAARHMAEEALAIATQSNDRRGIAYSWRSLGVVAHSLEEYPAARNGYERALALFQEMDDGVGTGLTLCNLGQMEMGEGHYDEACVLLKKSVALMRASGDWRLPHALMSFGRATHAQGNPELARSLLEEALIGWRKTGDRAGTAQSLVHLAELSHHCGDYLGAHSLLREALTIQRELGQHKQLSSFLWMFGRVAMAIKGPLATARLWGQSRRLHEEFVSAGMNARVQGEISTLRDALGQEAFEVAWNEGRAMTLDQAIEFALDLASAAPIEQAKQEHIVA
jgi:predicted ATPase/DNA-binding winged helix-turn-helix (wHTH) protein